MELQTSGNITLTNGEKIYFMISMIIAGVVGVAARV